MAPQAQIHLFGPPTVLDAAGTPIPKLGVGKPLALLAFLIVDGEAHRDAIVGLLWGDVPEQKARNAFRQALHRLRNALGENCIPHDPDVLRIAEDCELDTDVDAFQSAIDQGDFDLAIQHYRGEFLAGVDVGEPAFEHWATAKRASYHARYCDALRASLQKEIEKGAFDQATKKAARLSDAAPLDAEVAVLFASTLLGAGRRAEALQAIEQFSVRFERESGRTPPQSIREMAAKLRRVPSDTVSQSTGRIRAPIIGREKELSLLLSKWRQIQTGASETVFLVGEQGYGKTRLIEEFFARAKDLGSPLLLLGRERSRGSGVSYASIAEALRGALAASGLAGTSQHLLAEAARILPQLRDQFSLPDPPPISDDAGRLRFFEGVAALLDSVAYEQPVCLALDDFHNCSAVTAELAFYLTDRLQGAPVLFLFGARPTRDFLASRERFFHTASGRFRESGDIGPARDGRTSNLEVGALQSDDSRSLARAIGGGRLPDETLKSVIAIAGGVPYRLEDATDRALAGEPLGATPIHLREVLWGRLRTCTQAEQRLFVAAALLNRAASLRLLAAASHLSESSALDAALALESRGLLAQRENGIVPTHDFSGELALEGTGPAGRALLAGWAADALLHDGTGTAAELAALYSAAGRRAEAYRFSREAGYAAGAAGDLEEAAHHFSVALDAASNDRDRQEMARMVSATAPRPAQLTGEVASPAEVQAVRERTWETLVEPSPAEDAGPVSSQRSDEPPHRKLAGPTFIPRSVWIGFAAGIALFAAIRGFSKLQTSMLPGTSLSDTLLVAKQLSPRQSVIAFTTGPLGSPLRILSGATRNGMSASWIDSLRLPWVNPRPSPNRQLVALERITDRGSDLFVTGFSRTDTTPIAVSRGDAISEGWSPDGRWLLVTRGETLGDGSYHAGLFAHLVADPKQLIVLDTLSAHTVVDAAWSPDGSHIAWTARVGPDRQQEVFVSDADGQNVRNVSSDPNEDYSIAWSPDGDRIAFTSERTGFAELYSVEIRTGVMRRLTWDAAHADHATFSPDGRWIVYESTRGGSARLYLMASWGGTGRSIATSEERATIVGWRGPQPPYIETLNTDPLLEILPSQRQTLRVREANQFGGAMPAGKIRFRSLDESLVTVEASPQGTEGRTESADAVLTAHRNGLARVEISASGWRVDTAFIAVGGQSLSLLTEDFESSLNRGRWTDLGSPRARVEQGRGKNRSGGLVALSDRQWESGVLSAAVFPIRTGLMIDAWVAITPALETPGGESFDVALVAADPAGAADSVAPQFLRIASIAWLGQADRISYSVDRELFTEPAQLIGGSGPHVFGVHVEQDGTARFFVDGKARWKSTLRVPLSGNNSRAQLWLGSKNAGSSVAFDDISVRLTPIQSSAR